MCVEVLPKNVTYLIYIQDYRWGGNDDPVRRSNKNSVPLYKIEGWVAFFLGHTVYTVIKIFSIKIFLSLKQTQKVDFCSSLSKNIYIPVYNVM